MLYNVITIPPFEKEFKKLLKKYASLHNDLLSLIEQLEKDPTIGTPLGNNFYKIRLAITSKGKGKSGGARIITLVKLTAETVFLAAIYDKSEKSNISDTTLKRLAEIVTKLLG